MVKVSIIIPNYNHAQFFNQRIDSILNQSFQDFELIILDDCSNDDSEIKIEAYRNHPKVANIVYNEINGKSPFKQWVKGIDLAKGKYIWIAESDDFSESDFLKVCVAQLDKNEGTGFVYTDSNIIIDGLKNGEFKIGKNQSYKTNKWSNPYKENGLVELKHSLINNCTISNVSAVVFRKEAILTTSSAIEQFRYAGDWLCYMLICLNYEVIYVSECLNNYRSHAENLTKKSDHLYLGTRERMKARHMLLAQLNHKKNTLYKKGIQLNCMEFRVILGGFIRGKVSFKNAIETLIWCIK